MLFLLKIYNRYRCVSSNNDYPFSCINLKDRRAITSVVMPEFFWILSANFSDAMQPWSNSLLDHVTRNNSTFHVEHTSCAYFFFFFFKRDSCKITFFFFYSARNIAFQNGKSSKQSCAHICVYNYSTVIYTYYFERLASFIIYKKIVRFQYSINFLF